MTEVQIPAGRAVLSGNLTIPDNSMALVLFAHGSGSSRHSPRNQFVARTLNGGGLGTLLFDLLTPEEEALDIYTREHRFNISLLAERLVHATKWTRQQEEMRDLQSDISAQAQAALRHWLQQRKFHTTSGRSFPVVDVPIWLAMPCQKSKRRHCLSSAATMTLSSS